MRYNNKTFQSCKNLKNSTSTIGEHRQSRLKISEYVLGGLVKVVSLKIWYNNAGTIMDKK